MTEELEITSESLRIEHLLFTDRVTALPKAKILFEQLAGRWKKSPYSFSLSDIIPMPDYSMNLQPDELKTKMSQEESYKSGRKMNFSDRILKILEKIKDEEEIFKEIDKDQSLKTIIRIIEDVSLDLTQIDDSELLKRIKRVLALEAMSGILETLEPEQMEVFDKAIKRRPLFK